MNSTMSTQCKINFKTKRKAMNKKVNIKQNTFGTCNVKTKKISKYNPTCKLNKEGVNLTGC